ncbi:hypothetical protein D9615_009047 [Tricholomella constricta]|uniref:Uncharacterized protein n=1 Tax=Tricholomella constricta TaxID=117010 RepID=A0A8H5LYX4_9AGAR|nr:hypothetical protein D9615_009047 [Tricholomella constricta]
MSPLAYKSTPSAAAPGLGITLTSFPPPAQPLGVHLRITSIRPNVQNSLTPRSETLIPSSSTPAIEFEIEIARRHDSTSKKE